MINTALNYLLFPVIFIAISNSNLRNFIEAILYRIRAGCPWHDFLQEFGSYDLISRDLHE